MVAFSEEYVDRRAREIKASVRKLVELDKFDSWDRDDRAAVSSALAQVSCEVLSLKYEGEARNMACGLLSYVMLESLSGLDQALEALANGKQVSFAMSIRDRGGED